MELEVVLQLFKALNDFRVDYVLIGGVAINLHGIARATEDIDLFVRPTAENIERLRQALTNVWNDPEISQITLEDLAGDYPTIRYGPPVDDLVVDILSRLGEAFCFDDLEAELIDFKGIEVRVATPQTLIRMKQGTLRIQDQADAFALRNKFKL